jgi:hypothetical protein
MNEITVGIMFITCIVLTCLWADKCSLFLLSMSIKCIICIRNNIINPSIATPLLNYVPLDFYLKLIFVVTVCMYKEFVLRGTPLRYAPPIGHPDGAARLISATRYYSGGSRPVVWSTMIHVEQSLHSVILPFEL